MTLKGLCLLLSAACLLQFVSGCAALSGARGPSSDPVDRVWALVEQEKAGDARYLKARGREFLVFDSGLRSRLDETASRPDAAGKRDTLSDILSRAKDLGDHAAELQLARVPQDKAGTPHASLMEGYRAASAVRLEREIAALRGLDRPSELDRYASGLKSSIEESIKTKGRTLRQVMLLPFAPFVQLWMGYHIASTPEEKGGVGFAEADLYEPPPSRAAGPQGLDDAGLLEYYAPAIAVEKKQSDKYGAASDRFGRIAVEGETPAKAQPRVLTEEPAVYGYAETKTIQGSPVKMLVYTLWFPERPNVKGGFDPEVGATQGAIIRISLDEANRPVVYENVSSCGCYFKVFPAAELEARARRQYGAPLEGKRFAVEARVSGKIDANVPSLVEGDGRATAFFSSGAHEVMDIQTKMPPSLRVDRRTSYRLLPYDELESLPFNGGTISLFDSEGLVRNADRAEAALLAASGMYHAGTPRQRGTLMIYFDQADFDDPKLLETYLRLPDHAFRTSS